MIFKQHFVDLILSGKKTQTRRPNRGYYKVGHSYAIQPCRTCKGLEKYRIMMDTICEEYPPITMFDAAREGGYTSFSFEHAFKELYPKGDGSKRYAFKFHIVEVLT